jgi:hypothetical protein
MKRHKVTIIDNRHAQPESGLEKVLKFTAKRHEKAEAELEQAYHHLGAEHHETKRLRRRRDILWKIRIKIMEYL